MKRAEKRAPRDTEVPLSEIKAEMFKALAHPARIRALEILVEGDRSVAVTATTTGGPPLCVTASNVGHAAAGRAYVLFGLVYANGSNQAMGLFTTFVTHRLRQTGQNHWVLADAGC